MSVEGGGSRNAREALIELFKLFDEWLGERKPVVAVLVLPTGYGKTTASAHLLVEAARRGLRGAYVAPLRVLIKQTYTRALQSARDAGLSWEDVAYQAGLSVAEVAAQAGTAMKAPFIERLVNITTLDSFAMNLLGVPVAEAWRGSWHSDVAFAFTHTLDVLVLDEAHLMVSEDEVQRSTSVSNLASQQLELLARMVAATLANRGFVVVATATLPPKLVRSLLSRAVDLLQREYSLNQSVEVHVIGVEEFQLSRSILNELEGLPRCSVENNIVSDKDFHGKWCGDGVLFCVVDVDPDYGSPDESRRVEAKRRALQKALNIACGAEGCGRGRLGRKPERIAVIFNHVSDAVEAYKVVKELVSGPLRGCFGDYEVLLAHSRLTAGDRMAVEDRIIGGSKFILVATQVVEAGLDTNFDVLVTEAAPGSALVQRAGRVARPGSCSSVSCSDFAVILLSPRSSNSSDPALEWMVRGVYDADAVSTAVNALRSYDGECVDFRCLSKISGIIGDVAVTPASDVIDELERFVRPVRFVVDVLFEKLRGSFVREAALVPILVVDDECRELLSLAGRREWVEVSRIADLLRRAAERTIASPHYVVEYLHGRGLLRGSREAAQALVAYHRVRDGVVRFSIESVHTGRGEGWVLDYLRRLWLRSAEYSSRGVLVELIGFLMDVNVYRSQLNPS